MWALAWLRNSVNKDRAEKGEKIFNEAINSLQRRKDDRGRRLLTASKSFVDHLIDIAK